MRGSIRRFQAKTRSSATIGVAVAVLRVTELERVGQAVLGDLGQGLRERRNDVLLLVEVQEAAIQRVEDRDVGRRLRDRGIERVGILSGQIQAKDLLVGEIPTRPGGRSGRIRVRLTYLAPGFPALMSPSSRRTLPR